MSGDSKKSCPAQRSEDAIKWARENGLVVVLPLTDELLIDIDSRRDYDEFLRNKDIIEATYGIRMTSENLSRSGNRHIVMTLNAKISPLERIALQAVLGSDRRREAHSLRRLSQGEQNPTLFFEKP